MMPQDKKILLQESLRAIAAWHSAGVAQIQEKMDELIRAFDLDDASDAAKKRASPVANTSTFCVEWQGRTCFLGNTLVFRLFERLARSPNRYIAHVDLLDDVWCGVRESSTIRGVAKRLRDQLAAAGMSDLAAAIDGGVSGYYGLMLV